LDEFKNLTAAAKGCFLFEIIITSIIFNSKFGLLAPTAMRISEPIAI
jgi:hypothetical protein